MSLKLSSNMRLSTRLSMTLNMPLYGIQHEFDVPSKVSSEYAFADGLEYSFESHLNTRLNRI
jgi:hypothetical protein